jgi:molecular chaperone GrpE
LEDQAGATNEDKEENSTNGEATNNSKEFEKALSEVNTLKKEIDDERRRSGEMANRMKYLQADIMNLQRQSDKMVAEARNQVRLSWILEIISIREDLERGLRAFTSMENKSLAEGLNLVMTRINNTLRSEEVENIKAEIGSVFDPKIHEAVGYQETDEDEQGKIVAVVSPGYVSSGRVIKPALVEVTRKRSVPNEKSKSEFEVPVEDKESPMEMKTSSPAKSKSEL